MDPETKTDIKLAIALALLVLLGLSAGLRGSQSGTLDWWTPYDSYGRTGDENITAVTGQFLSGDASNKYSGAEGAARAGMPLLAPFEILSVLLLAALIGAVAVAMREKEPGRRDSHDRSGRGGGP